jgi:hypothetical protein
MHFGYGAITHSGPPFQVTSPIQQLGNSVHDLTLTLSVPLPRISNAIRLDTDTVWSIPVSLAATQGVAVAFLSSGYLDVSIPPVPSSDPMYSGRGNTQ